MTLEQRSAGMYVGLLALVVGTLWLVTRIYARDLTALLIARCPGSLAFMFGSWSQLGALGVLAMSSGLITFVVTRFGLSMLKTWWLQERNALSSSVVVPRKLHQLCQQYELSLDQIKVVVGNVGVYTIGLGKTNIIVAHSIVSRLTKAQLGAVLLHEQYHQERDHTVYYLLADSVLLVLGWLPIVREVVAWMKNRFEQAADQYAARRQGTPKYVVQALCVLAKQPVPSFAIGFGGVQVADRIAALYDMPQTQPVCTRRSIVSSLAALGFLMMILFGPAVVPTPAAAQTDRVIFLQRSEANVMCGEVMSRQQRLRSEQI